MSTSGIQPGTLGRAKLGLSGRLVLQLEDPPFAMDMLVAEARHSRPTADPLAELQSVPLETINGCIERWIRPDVYAFSVTGPLLEEDIEQYESGALDPTTR